ncbi:MAG: RNA-binding S4 domain-containing protein [Thermicanus sp.]|nr:RNA-binding S4 domain-containing protein [Thermicanus sp.]
MEKVSIEGEYITLGQFLKKMGIVQTGGEVKAYLEKGILVNNQVEMRRGKKLYAGDEIRIPGEKDYRILGKAKE